MVGCIHGSDDGRNPSGDIVDLYAIGLLHCWRVDGWKSPNKRVVPDHKLYFVDADTREEAHCLAAYLNSRPVRTWLGGFLHGKQIATTVFEFMHVPKFEKNNTTHRQLALISLSAHRDRAGTFTTDFLAPEHEEELSALVRSIAADQS